MKKLWNKPVLMGTVIGLFFLLICIFIPIPMYDGIAFYKKGLVDFHAEGKLALSYFFGIGTDKLTVLGLKPTSFQFKGIGIVLFGLIHIGLPALIALRFYYAQQRKSTEE